MGYGRYYMHNMINVISQEKLFSSKKSEKVGDKVRYDCKHHWSEGKNKTIKNRISLWSLNTFFYILLRLDSSTQNWLWM